MWAGDAVSVDSKLGDDGETLQEVSMRIKQLFSVRKAPNLLRLHSLLLRKYYLKHQLDSSV